VNPGRRSLGRWLLVGAALGFAGQAAGGQAAPARVNIHNQGRVLSLRTVAPDELGTLPQSPELRYVEGPEGQLWGLTHRLLIARRASSLAPALPGVLAPLPWVSLARVGDLQVDALEPPDIDTTLRWIPQLQDQVGVLSVQVDVSQNLPWPAGSVPALRATQQIHEMARTMPRNGFWQPADFDVLAATGVRSSRAISRGQGVRVAVIDSGVDLRVPALQRLQALARFDADADLQSGRSPSDMEAHASGVAGLILGRSVARPGGALFEGVAPEAGLIDIRLQSGWTSSLVMALGMAHQAQADVINCSFQLPWLPEPVALLIDALAREGRQGKGAVVVVAAGNRAESLNGRHSLANHPAVLAVTASDHQGHTGWTASGRDVFLSAPGDLLSPGPGTGYQTLSSTSAATAVVSGVTALLLAVRPQSTLAQVRQWLARGAYRDPALRWPGGRNEQQGHGAVRADQALALALQTSP
jgi:subtilisin family serine protease